MTPEAKPEKADYRSEVPLEFARADIERSFSDLQIREMSYLGSGLANTAFVVNDEIVFRFSKHENGSTGLRREKSVLRLVQGHVDIPIPNPSYDGTQSKTGFYFLGHKKIDGEKLSVRAVKENEALRVSAAQKLGYFMQQLHAIDPKSLTREPVENTYDIEKRKLENARIHLYPVLDELYPADATRIKGYIEMLITQSIAYHESEKYKPTLLHGDLEAEHILYNPDEGKISGIIDWGGTEIGDPDYDLWRLYSHYGIEFIDEILKTYPHPDREKLLEKCEFFYRSQMVRRAVRPLEVGDKENALIRTERLRKQALNLGYWYSELL